MSVITQEAIVKMRESVKSFYDHYGSGGRAVITKMYPVLGEIVFRRAFTSAVAGKDTVKQVMSKLQQVGADEMIERIGHLWALSLSVPLSKLCEETADVMNMSNGEQDEPVIPTEQLVTGLMENKLGLVMFYLFVSFPLGVVHAPKGTH